VQSIRRVDVYRIAEKPNAPAALTEEEFSSLATLLGSVTYDEIKKAGSTLTYVDRSNWQRSLFTQLLCERSRPKRGLLKTSFNTAPSRRTANHYQNRHRVFGTANTITWEPRRQTPMVRTGKLLASIYRTNNGAPPLTGQSPLNPQPITATSMRIENSRSARSICT